MRTINRGFWTVLGLTVAAAAACSDVTSPVDADNLAGRWEGTSTAGVAYFYEFEAAGTDSTNPRTGNTARKYHLAYTTEPGGSGTISAWFEGGEAYWGGSTLARMVDDSTMTVEAENVPAFIMRKR